MQQKINSFKKWCIWRSFLRECPKMEILHHTRSLTLKLKFEVHSHLKIYLYMLWYIYKHFQKHHNPATN